MTRAWTPQRAATIGGAAYLITSATAAIAAVRALPAVALVLLAVILVPIFAFEVTLGLWLLGKGVRVPEHTPQAQPEGAS